jgi:hypothetical protein
MSDHLSELPGTGGGRGGEPCTSRRSLRVAMPIRGVHAGLVGIIVRRSRCFVTMKGFRIVGEFRCRRRNVIELPQGYKLTQAVVSQGSLFSPSASNAISCYLPALSTAELYRYMASEKARVEGRVLSRMLASRVLSFEEPSRIQEWVSSFAGDLLAGIRRELEEATATVIS